MATTQEEDEELWNDNFYRLSALKEKYGQAVKLSFSDDNELSLNQWWQTQKLELDPEDPVDEIKIDALASIGYSVKTSNNYLPNRNSLPNRTDVVVEDWHSRYQSLVEFYQKHGHYNVPKDYPHDNLLHQWVVTQREEEFLLPEDKKQKLDQLGFFDVVLRPRLLKVWVPPGSIGLGIGTQHDGLGNYISKVRSDSLLKDRIFVGDHLLAVDDTDVREMTCHEIADLLLQRSKNKRLLSIHTDSNSIQEAQNNIHNDVEGETKEGEDAKMSDNDIDVLTNPTAASCVFDLTDESSSNQKSKNNPVLSFYTDSNSIQEEQNNIHNDAGEETKEDEGAKSAMEEENTGMNKELATISQPSINDDSNEEGDLSDDEITIVDKFTQQWEMMYQQLREYRIVHGHCNVPYKWKKNPKLGIFVSNTRQHYANVMLGRIGPKIKPERISKLERIGFNWGQKWPNPKSWDEMFADLEIFKECYGHCNVPSNQSKTPLAVWCANQRYENKLAKHGQVSLLTDDQYNKLQALGFKWKAPTAVLTNPTADSGVDLAELFKNSSSEKNNDKKESVGDDKSSKKQQEGENDSTKGEEPPMKDRDKPDSPSLEEKYDLKIPKKLKDHNGTGSYWVVPTTKRRRTTPSFDDSSKKLQQQQISPKQAAMKDLLSPSDANKPSNAPILSPSDANEPSNAPISNTTSHDVLFGRGNMINSHPGNRRFRDIIASHIPEYVRASKGGGKLNVASKIVRAVRLGNPPGRFLRIGPDNMWRDVGDKVAVEKTSQAIRDRSNVNKRQRYGMRESLGGDSVGLDGTMQMKRINQKLTLLPSKVSNVEVIDVDAMEDDDHCKVSFGTKIKTNNSPLRQKPSIDANDNGNDSKQNEQPIASGERKRKISESSCSDGLVVATTAAAAVRNRSMEDSGIVGSRIFSTEENDPYLKSLNTLIAQLDQDKETLLQLQKRRRMFLANARRLPDPETTTTPQEEWL